MGQSITPIAYRVGFFRSWDSLYTESLYFKNYNLFVKSQLLCLYVEGFFNKWTWDGRRSYFLNFIFSHLEVSWSFNFIQLYIYVYTSGIEYIHYKLKRELFFFKQLKETRVSDVFRRFDKGISNPKIYMKNLGSLFRFFFGIADFNKKLSGYNRGFLTYEKRMHTKRLFFKQVPKKKRVYWRLQHITRRLSTIKKRFFKGRTGIYKRFGVQFSHKKYNRNNLYLKNFVRVFTFLKKIAFLRFFKTYLNFSNYFLQDKISEIS